MCFAPTAGTTTILSDNEGDEDVFNAEITVDKIFQAISKVGYNKSPGNNGQGTEFYLHIKIDIAPILCVFFSTKYSQPVLFLKHEKVLFTRYINLVQRMSQTTTMLSLWLELGQFKNLENYNSFSCPIHIVTYVLCTARDLHV